MERTLEDQLDELLVKAKNDESVLPDIAATYTLLIAERSDSANKYILIVESVIKPWTLDDNLPQGILYLVQALNSFYGAKYHEALDSTKKAVTIFEKYQMGELHGCSLLFLGATLRGIGELDEAVSKLMKATTLIKPEGVYAKYFIFCHYQLAEIYVGIGDQKGAELHYQIAAERAEILNDVSPLFRSLNGLGGLYASQGDKSKAKEYLTKAIEIAETDSQLSRGLCDLGVYYLQEKEFKKAREKLEESYDLRLKGGFVDASSTSLIHLCELELAEGNIDKAKEYGEKALNITIDYKAINKSSKCYKSLSLVHEKLGNWQKAYDYQKKYISIQDELSNKKIRKIYKLKNEQIELQKLKIEEVHREITDSIQYAKRIQAAILPSEHLMQKYLPNYFVLYKPKDIVAGDFYWLEPVNSTSPLNTAHNKLQSKVLFAAADCTGHGVPGAMVSLVCNNALNRSVREYGLTDPGEVLNKTREIVISEFKKSSPPNTEIAQDNIKDGMDIALVVLDTSSQNSLKLTYAGAHNPLWIVRSGSGEIEEIKGNKQPIGVFDRNVPFKTHEVKLNVGDSIYLFSDGFADQFGGIKGKKYKTKNLKKLILSVQSEPMKRQKELINQAFEDWKGNLEQLDDVCIIGVRV